MSNKSDQGRGTSSIPAIWRLFAIIISLCCIIQSASAYKFLVVLPTGARSHFIVGSALAKGLAEKGHQITMISPFPQKKPIANYNDIATPTVMKAMEAKLDNLFETSQQMKGLNVIKFMHEMTLELTETVLMEDSVQKFLKSNQTFDAVICEVFMNEALYGFAEHFNAPLIGLGTFGAVAWNTDMVGSPSPPSYVPHALLPFTDSMSLWQRIANFAFLAYERLYIELVTYPDHEAIYKRVFPDAKRSLAEVQRNAALVLLNTHVSLAFSRPYVPNHIEVGGMHVNRKRNPLPDDLQKFIDEAKHGVIYFSMGSNLRSKDLPAATRKFILDTFRGLKQRVLWKFETTELEGKPENLYISSWFPQDDILAHPNVRMFITHGGLLSLTETIYHGKPVIGIPIFGDQFLNMARAQSIGFGLQLNYRELTQEAFSSAIQRILNEPTFTKKVQDMSSRYRDQPREPLDLAIFWVEHVARHKGATYLHNRGLDLNFIQYHSLDVIAIIVGGFLLIFWILLATLRRIFRAVFGNGSQKTTEQQRKKKKN